MTIRAYISDILLRTLVLELSMLLYKDVISNIDRTNEELKYYRAEGLRNCG